MESFLAKVRRTISRYGLLNRGDKVVVGVSGGPDSLALLYCLLELRDEFGVSLHVAHLNHLLRGEAAAREAAFVSRLAEDLGLPATVEARDVRAYRKECRLSVEEAAREVRYAFLREVAARVGARKIAVGHQADDQAETVLLNLLRGSGLAGLKAMVPCREGIIRPLLFVSRAEIEAYCREKGLQPCCDWTNWDTAYRRNKIRHELLPLLARQYNPAVVPALARTAALLAEENELLEDLARQGLARVVLERGPASLLLDREAFLGLAPALQRRALRAAAVEVGGGAEFEHVEALREIIRAGTGALTLPKGVQVRVEGGRIRFGRPGRGAGEAPVFSYPLRVPGVTSLPEIGRAIRAEVLPPPERVVAPPHEAWLDWERIAGPLVVRNWRPGDRFSPLGMKGSKKLQDLFVDAGVPAAERRRLPVVAAGKNIIWVAGVRIAENYKITPATKEALHLVLEGEEG
ncbi:tRNA lysidine(34) synthetase TilS [Thermanaeromonas sp. C210]|uniref:tRNA lysidine(34) synthetase TilS n=1 Tax=Thermanaeromonas sp. C210 TaxID=2731925 RepID=UPI00156768BE|nr:tRNA lysidine(34) synthetase TilS [Thermanaeromonas sp. C210]